MSTAVLTAVLLTAACSRPCRWESHGACVAVDSDNVVTRQGWTDEQWQAVIDATIEHAIQYWDSGGIDGWTIVLYDHMLTCYEATAEGCVTPLTKEIHLDAYTDCPLAVLPHEIGHAVLALNDPFHWSGGWATIDADRRATPHQFAVCTP